MKSLKLTALEADALSDKAMSKIMGGYYVIRKWTRECGCGCGCRYANSGGSSDCANGNANCNNCFD